MQMVMLSLYLPKFDKGVLSKGINKQNRKNNGFSNNNLRELFIEFPL